MASCLGHILDERNQKLWGWDSGNIGFQTYHVITHYAARIESQGSDVLGSLLKPMLYGYIDHTKFQPAVLSATVSCVIEGCI